MRIAIPSKNFDRGLSLRKPARSPIRFPISQDRTVVVSISPSVHGSALAIICITGVGYADRDGPKS